MTNKLENDVLAIIKTSPGIKAKDIAKKLNIERSQVNALLYGALRSCCFQDTSYCWFLNDGINVKEAETIDANQSIPDKELSDLCKYYLNCLSLEENNGVSAFLSSKYNLNYAELRSLDLEESNDAAMKLAQKASTERNLTAYIGYPVMIEKFYSNKTKQEYCKIAPVLLFPVDTTNGATEVTLIPSVNMEIIKQYSAKDINSQVYDLVELETELGLNNTDADIEIDEIVARLQVIRQWLWKENINPENITHEIPIDELTEEGIYNRAIFIVTERSPFTIGLESELSKLMLMDKDSYKDTVLYNWIHRDDKGINNGVCRKDESLLEVLPLNSEQEQAIYNAMSDNLTIITGPPGTGKSQVVTNLLANIAWKGGNALFSSKNNKAVDIVDRRINSIGHRPIMLRIGSSQYAYRLADLISDVLSHNADQNDKDEYNQYKKSYDEGIVSYSETKKQKDQIISLRNDVDKIEQYICTIRDKCNNWTEKVSVQAVNEFAESFDKFLLSYNEAVKAKQSLLVRLFWFVIGKSRINNLKSKIELLNTYLVKYDLSEVSLDIIETDTKLIDQICKEIRSTINILRKLIEYAKKLSELCSIESIEDIDRRLSDQKNILADIAEKLWDKWLIMRPLEIDSNKRVKMNQYVTAMKLVGDVDLSKHLDLRKQFNQMQREMTRLLPCWAVTSLSAKGHIPFQAGVFDIVIIDEASQCDIASVIPLLYRAKRAVIIGDPKQLSHISSISKAQDVNLLQKYCVGFEWSYSANSLYSLASSIANPDEIIQLRDHHRSFETIIGYSNAEFYEGKLRVATKYDTLKYPTNTNMGIRLTDVVGQTVRPPSGGAYNEEEVVCIISELRRLVIENNYRGSVGVITPFRAQAEHIQAALEKLPDIREHLVLYNEFLVDTVHKFQGDERDLMIFSPVISTGTNSGAISFLKNTGNLFNVAITRARAVLVMVGDLSYCSKCGVSYMEHFIDYAYKCNDQKYTDANEDKMKKLNREYPSVSNVDQVSDWEKILYSALFDVGVKTIPQYSIDKYKLDLALIHGENRLDIEVDGEMYHKAWNGELCYRDQLRNQRLFEMGWDVKRFWVYQVRDNLGWCIDQIQQWLTNH